LRFSEEARYTAAEKQDRAKSQNAKDNPMNWKLIFLLSLFGLAMGFATVFLIPTKIEPAFWLIIFLISAYLIAKRCASRLFLHGLLVGLVNCVWVTSAHILFIERYLLGHAHEAAMLDSMTWPDSQQGEMALMGLGIGVISGVVLGLFAFVAGKLVRGPRLSGSRSRA